MPLRKNTFALAALVLTAAGSVPAKAAEFRNFDAASSA